jgi:hypothetical protein
MAERPKIWRSDPVGIASWDYKSPVRSILAVALAGLATALSIAHAAL